MPSMPFSGPSTFLSVVQVVELSQVLAVPLLSSVPSHFSPAKLGIGLALVIQTENSIISTIFSVHVDGK